MHVTEGKVCGFRHTERTLYILNSVMQYAQYAKTHQNLRYFSYIVLHNMTLHFVQTVSFFIENKTTLHSSEFPNAFFHYAFYPFYEALYQ